MAEPEAVDKPKRLSKAEADALANEFLQCLGHISVGGESCGPEYVAAFTHIGFRFFDEVPPKLPETGPEFLRSIFQPVVKVSGRNTLSKAKFARLKNELNTYPKTAEGVRTFISSRCRKMPPDEVQLFRELIRRIKEATANPKRIRDDLISELKKNLREKPGPKSGIARESLIQIQQASSRLRPVCEKVLDFSENESKQPMATVIAAVQQLRPEWGEECGFLLSNLDLIEESMQLAKIRRSKIRGKASKLADALACKFASIAARPAYSMQLAEVARRIGRGKTSFP
jgi:hypothetical protein